jgi:hypothetical protein
MTLTETTRKYLCAVCKCDLGWDAPSGVCSSVCLHKAQGFDVPTDQSVTLRSQAIDTLLAIRASAAAELAVMPTAKQGSEWARDRYQDVQWCNRALARLGVDVSE